MLGPAMLGPFWLQISLSYQQYNQQSEVSLLFPLLLSTVIEISLSFNPSTPRTVATLFERDVENFCLDLELYSRCMFASVWRDYSINFRFSEIVRHVL